MLAPCGGTSVELQRVLIKEFAFRFVLSRQMLTNCFLDWEDMLTSATNKFLSTGALTM